MARKRKFQKTGNTSTKTSTTIVEETGSFLGSVPSSALVKDSANLNYSFIPGSRIFKQGGFNGNTPSLPGIMSFPVVPNIGADSGNSTPINLAANMIYRKVRAANSGAKNYDANNLMIYIMALDSIYAFHSWMCRIYGSLRWFTPYNRYTPEAIVTAMRVDYEDIMANVANFKRYIDLFGMKANTLAIPATVPFITNHLKMYAKIYMDKKSDRGQMYLFNPDGFYHYNENLSSGQQIGTLNYETIFPNNEATLKLSNIIAIGNSLLNDIMNSEDLLIMSGDIIKAYEGNIISIPEIAEDYSVIPVYDMDTLTAIHNAMTLTTRPTVGNITWELDGRISQSLKVSDIDVLPEDFSFTIDQHKDDVSIEDNINAIRFTYFTSPTSKDILTCGPELLIKPSVFWLDDHGNLTQSAMELSTLLGSTGTTATDQKLSTITIKNILRNQSAISTFDMHPKYELVITESVGSTTLSTTRYASWEVYNPTIVSTDTYENMMLSYYMAQFGIQ